MTARRLSAFAALGRGLANLRGNLDLVAVAAGGALLIAALALLSLQPVFRALGLSLADFFASLDPLRQDEALSGLDPARLLSGDLVVPLLLFAAGITLVSLVQCWLQAGILGVLAAADAQAPPGPGRPALAFRTFSGRFFAAEASRLFGRVLAYYALVLAVAIAGLGVLLLLIGGAALAGGRFGGTAAVAIGCGGAIPLAFAGLVLALAATFGQADLPRAGGSARAALGTGLRTLSQRLGACVGIYALGVAAALAVGVFTGGAGAAVRAAFGPASLAGATVEIALFLVQTLAQTLLGVALAAAAIALVRAERAAAEPAG